MNTHDIDIELPPLPSGHPTYEFPDGAYDSEQMHQYARAAIEAYRKQHFENGVALQRYKECGGDEESDPVERLRFYCSLAMSGQDWLDVEPFFGALLAEARKQEEAIGAGGVSGKRITDDGALEALQACEQAYHRMIVDGTPQDCRAHDAARVAFWRVFGGAHD